MGRNVAECISVMQLLVLQVNKQTILMEKISSIDGMTNISHNKLHVEVLPEATLEEACARSKGRD